MIAGMCAIAKVGFTVPNTVFIVPVITNPRPEIEIIDMFGVFRTKTNTVVTVGTGFNSVASKAGTVVILIARR